MKHSLFVAWQDKRSSSKTGPATRRWFPIGRLEMQQGQYFFRYTKGALKARDEAGFEPLAAFPALNEVYESSDLFSVFRNRLPNPARDDYAAMVKRLDLPADHEDPFEILALTEGARQTDNLEVFAPIRKGRDGRFRCRCFLHGWRHVSEEAQQCMVRLTADKPLQLALEFNNPATGEAIQLQTPGEYHVIGWAPRYLVHDLVAALWYSPAGVEARVVRFNPPPAPYNQRVMIEISGRLPADFDPMSRSDYRPLVGLPATA